MFLGKLFSTSLQFPILNVKFLMAQIIKKNVYEEKFFYKITILEDYLYILKIENSKVVENIFPKELSHYL